MATTNTTSGKNTFTNLNKEEAVRQLTVEERYELITGLSAKTGPVSNISLWNHVKSGKDLFIKGLGSFDIRTAAQRLIEQSGHRSNVTPGALKTIGYFNSTDFRLILVVMDDDYFMILNNIIRFRKQWTEELLGRVDELVDAVNLSRDFAQSSIFNRPPAALLTAAAQLTLDIDMKEAREDLGDAPFQVIEVPEVKLADGYSLRVALSPQELLAMAHMLDVCVDSPQFAAQVHLGNIQIWGLYKDRNIVGIGELKLGYTKSWEQIRGYKNANLTDAQVALFNSLIQP